jgi:hypothetical protein
MTKNLACDVGVPEPPKSGRFNLDLATPCEGESEKNGGACGHEIIWNLFVAPHTSPSVPPKFFVGFWCRLVCILGVM